MSFINRIRDAKPGETVNDKDERASVKGLHLRVSASGSKSFMLFYRTQSGTQRRPKIGKFPELTVGEARARAKEMLHEVALGRDPQGEKNTLRGGHTVESLFEAVYAAHWSDERYQESGWAKQVKNAFSKHVLPEFGKRKVSELTKSDLVNWHLSFKESPYQGNRVLEMLNKMFAYAEMRDWHTGNPCKGVTPFKEKKRDRYASVEELQAVIRILEREKAERPGAVAFLYILMFTGSRPKAIRDATWDQLTAIERDGKQFGILSFKGKTTADTGLNEAVAVPPFVMGILDTLPKMKGRPICGVSCVPQKFWERIKKEADLGDLRIRDLRRTFATIGMSGGVNMSTIGELLNHKSDQTTKIYAKLDTTARLNAVEVIADRIKALTFVSADQVESDCSHESNATPRPKTENTPRALKLH